jgi:hypothetical protein
MSEKAKTVLLFLFFVFVVLLRIYLETDVFAKRSFFGYFVVFHHFFWYTFVFFYFSICNRYILGMNLSKIKYTVFITPVIMIPVIHSAISGNNLDLKYLDGSLIQNFYHMVTLYWKHPKNSGFFIEMVVLLLFFTAGSWLVSRSLTKTVFNIFIGFYGCMVFAGLHLFGVAPRTKAYFKINTALKNHELLSLIYFSLAVIVFLIYSYPEIKSHFKDEKIRWIITFSSGILLSITVNLLFFENLYLKPPRFADYIIMTVPYAAFVSGINSLDKTVSNKFKTGRFFPLFFSISGTMIVLGIYLRVSYL